MGGKVGEGGAVVKGFTKWLRSLLSGKPHFAIGGWENPYLLRWYLIPRNRWFNVYLHKFLRDDDDRALHDHPWWFVSIVIKGGYFEYVEGARSLVRSAPSIAYRPAELRHRVRLFRDLATGKLISCWTLVITGRKSREWGFWCPQGFVPWHEFVAPNDEGAVGRGCD